MAANCYDFPVALHEAYTKDGIQAPKVKVVVREDTGVPLATVSENYGLITHNSVIAEARKFISVLGEPVERFGLARNGAVMWGEFTYLDRTIEPVVGEPIGLRVYVENSYNSRKAVTIDVGGLVLSCKNGMTAFNSRNRYTWRHTKNSVIRMPSPDDILYGFEAEGRAIASLNGRYIEKQDLDYINSKIKTIFSEVQLKNLENKLEEGQSAWDGLQALTYEATHIGNAGFVSRMRKLASISKIFKERFEINEYR